MSNAFGRSALGLVTFLALASTLLTLSPALQVSGQVCPMGCSGHGTCLNSSCACTPGYVGTNCNVPTCATDADCDDSDACTTDTCDTASGICDHTSNVEGCMDSMWCYQAKIRSGSPKFPATPTHLADIFQSKNMTITKPAWSCEPVSRNGGPINNVAIRFECFQVKQDAHQNKFLGASIDSTTALGTDPLSIKSGKLLCLPSSHP